MGAANGIKPLSERHFAVVRVGANIRQYNKNFYLIMGRICRFCSKVVGRSLEGRWKGEGRGKAFVIKKEICWAIVPILFEYA